MKLIVERLDGAVYVYRETETHFYKMQDSRTTTRLDPVILDNECDISHIDGDFHMVFDLAKDKKKAKK